VWKAGEGGLWLLFLVARGIGTEKSRRKLSCAYEGLCLFVVYLNCGIFSLGAELLVGGVDFGVEVS
jgi:hypothetical protein